MAINSKILKCVEIDEMNLSLSPYVNDVLDICASINSANKPVELESLINSLGLNEVKLRVERYISKTYLESGDNSGDELFKGLSEANAKDRYRKLIRIFHPDRGINDQAWLNRRSEKINKAFQRFKIQKLDPVSIADNNKTDNFAGKSQYVNSRETYSGKFRRTGFLKKYAGKHRNIQSILFKSVVGAFGLLLILTLLASFDFSGKPKSVNKVSNSTNADVINSEALINEQELTRAFVQRSEVNKLNMQKNLIKDSTVDTGNLSFDSADNINNHSEKVSKTEVVFTIRNNKLSETVTDEIKKETYWIYKPLLILDEVNKLATVKGSSVRYRAAPTTLEDNVKGSLDKGGVLTLISIQGDWCEVALTSREIISVMNNGTQQYDGEASPKIEQASAEGGAGFVNSDQLNPQDSLTHGVNDQASKTNMFEPVNQQSPSINELPSLASTQAESSRINSADINKLLTKFRRGFAAGNTDDLMALYLYSAKEAGVIGRGQILRRYERLFALHNRRNMQIKKPTVRLNDYGAVVSVSMETNVWYEPEKADTLMLAEFVLVVTNNGLRIASLETY